MSDQDPNAPTIQQMIDTAASPQNFQPNGATPPIQPPMAPPAPAQPSLPAGSVPAAPDNRAAWDTAQKPVNLMENLNTPEGAALMASGGIMKAILASSLQALSKKAPQPDAGQRAGHIIDSFFAPMRGQTGGIGGAGNAAAARIAQQDAQQKEKLDQFNDEHKQAISDLKDGLNISMSNAQMIHSQYLLHKADLDENIADGTRAADLLEHQVKPGEVVARDVDAAEIKRQIAMHTQDPNTGYDLSTMTPFATGKKQVGTDPNGNPQWQATYDIVRLPKEVSISDPEEAKLYFPETRGLENVSKETPLVVPGSLYNARFQAYETAQAVKATSQKAADAAAEATQSHAEKVEQANFAGSNIWAQDLAQVSRNSNNKSLSEPELWLAAYRLITTNPQKDANGKILYPNIDKDIRAQIGEKNFDAIMQESLKAADRRDLERQKAQDKQDTIDANRMIVDATPNQFGDTNINPATGQPFESTDANKAYSSFNQKVLVPLQTNVDKSYNMSLAAYTEYQQAKAQGKELPTGAQSMLMLSNHLSTTFGNVKGARITKDMIEHHLGARGVSDNAVVAVQRLTNGDVLSPTQWTAFMGLISQSRQFGFQAAIDNARSSGLGHSIPTFLPKAPTNGTPLDDGTANIYSYAAHGNAALAAQAAIANGWTLTPKQQQAAQQVAANPQATQNTQPNPASSNKTDIIRDPRYPNATHLQAGSDGNYYWFDGAGNFQGAANAADNAKAKQQAGVK